jgi:hypothetical protein
MHGPFGRASAGEYPTRGGKIIIQWESDVKIVIFLTDSSLDQDRMTTANLVLIVFLTHVVHWESSKSEAQMKSVS